MLTHSELRAWNSRQIFLSASAVVLAFGLMMGMRFWFDTVLVLIVGIVLVVVGARGLSLMFPTSRPQPLRFPAILVGLYILAVVVGSFVGSQPSYSGSSVLLPPDVYWAQRLPAVLATPRFITFSLAIDILGAISVLFAFWQARSLQLHSPRRYALVILLPVLPAELMLIATYATPSALMIEYWILSLLVWCAGGLLLGWSLGLLFSKSADARDLVEFLPRS